MAFLPVYLELRDVLLLLSDINASHNYKYSIYASIIVTYDGCSLIVNVYNFTYNWYYLIQL